jgi:hypothetical protein
MVCGMCEILDTRGLGCREPLLRKAKGQAEACGRSGDGPRKKGDEEWLTSQAATLS